MLRFWIVLASATILCGQARTAADLAAFDQVWSTVRDTHWEKTTPGGLDWNAMRTEYRPRVEAAKTTAEARAVTQEMLRRLKQTHFGIVPGFTYESLAEEGGSGTTGIDVRVLDGQVVVTSVDPGSPAEHAGVHPGWVVRSVNGKALTVPDLPELALTRAMLARLSGPVGGSIEVVFDAATLKLSLTVGRGTLAEFGNLPATRVWYEERRIGATAYVGFNVFMDIPHLIPSFEKTIQSCKPCDGLIIDLRGNPGGIGGMAMGMAGFLVDKANQRLGTMFMRDATLNFVINPRAEVFTGPVAFLLDGTSASTSEIFAGGLQDLGRARVFGTRSAAAALPSVFTTLPNGDGFQYAIANYISQGGKALEGAGVTPDEEVKLTREGLLNGHDAVIEAALAWIEKVKK
ncbi:MAG: S41 family peptidase [Bryobacteraceae bacterium]